VPTAIVIHYDPAEAEQLAARIRREGFEAEACPVRGTAVITFVRRRHPDVVVIDLMRMPSYGRALGCLLREQKSTRGIVLVFMEGEPEKTRLVRKVLPDAVFTNLLRLGPALEKALRAAPAEPVVPDLTQIPPVAKLRIQEGATVALLRAPDGFQAKLEPLPKKVKLQTTATGAGTILLFLRSSIELGRELPRIAPEVAPGKTLWLIWPKKASGVRSDLTVQRIWQACPAFGLAPYKTCAIDETWSALAVAAGRRARRASHS